MRVLFALFALIFGASLAPANVLPPDQGYYELAFFQPQRLITAVSTKCPYSADGGLADGCFVSNPNATYRLTNCWPASASAPSDLRYSPASVNSGAGQVWNSGGHPPTVDVPGCDYPVGATTLAATMLTSQANYDPLVQSSPGVYTNPQLVPVLTPTQGGTAVSFFTGTMTNTNVGGGHFEEVLTVTSAVTGTPLSVNEAVYGGSVPFGYYIKSQQTGSPGGTGTYYLNQSAAGTLSVTSAGAGQCLIVNPADGTGTSVPVNTADYGNKTFTGWFPNQNLPMIYCSNPAFTGLSNLYWGAAWSHPIVGYGLGPNNVTNIVNVNNQFILNSDSFWTDSVYCVRTCPMVEFLNTTFSGTDCRLNVLCIAGNGETLKGGFAAGGGWSLDYSVVVDNLDYVFGLNGSVGTTATGAAGLSNIIMTHSVMKSCAWTPAIGHPECGTGTPSWNNFTLNYDLVMVGGPNEAGLTEVFHTQNTGVLSFNYNINMTGSVYMINSPGEVASGTGAYWFTTLDAAAAGCSTTGLSPTCPPGSSVLYFEGVGASCTPVAGHCTTTTALPSTNPVAPGWAMGGTAAQIRNLVGGNGYAIGSLFLFDCAGNEPTTSLCPISATATGVAGSSYDPATGFLTLAFPRSPVGSIAPPGGTLQFFSVTGCTGVGADIATLNGSWFNIPSVDWSIGNSPTAAIIQVAQTVPLTGKSITSITSCTVSFNSRGQFAASTVISTPFSNSGLTGQTTNDVVAFQNAWSVTTTNANNWFDVTGMNGLSPVNNPGGCVDTSGFAKNNQIFYTPSTGGAANVNLYNASSGFPQFMGCDLTLSGVGSQNWWGYPFTGAAGASSASLATTAAVTYCADVETNNTHNLIGLGFWMPSPTSTNMKIQYGLYAGGTDYAIPMRWGTSNAQISFAPLTAGQKTIIISNGGSGTITDVAGVITIDLGGSLLTAANVVAAIPSSAAASDLTSSIGLGTGASAPALGTFLVGYPGFGTGNNALTFTPASTFAGNGFVTVTIAANSGAGTVVATTPASATSTGTIIVTPPAGGWTTAQLVTAWNAAATNPNAMLTVVAGGTGAGTPQVGTVVVYTAKPVGAPLARSHTGGSGAGFTGLAVSAPFTPMINYAWTSAQPASGQGGSSPLPLAVTPGQVLFACEQVNDSSGTFKFNSASQIVNDQLQFSTAFGTWPNYDNTGSIVSPLITSPQIWIETNDKQYP